MASDIFGVSGRAMMAALIAGDRNPALLAQVARASMRAKISALVEAFTDHHAFLLRKMLAWVDQIYADIAHVDAKIEELVAPFAGAVERLDEIPASDAPPPSRKSALMTLSENAQGRSLEVPTWLISTVRL
ncbi:hypothetical protein AB0L65_62895 [Nonomuraea sp. NPDC052116]|uniref:hypothetical protein n=1 Tax=Nonomuraea sp. NPDC052116 TaxID=3155665 RepID=UPI003418CEE2